MIGVVRPVVKVKLLEANKILAIKFLRAEPTSRESWGPKGSVGRNREMQNGLRVGTFLIYGTRLALPVLIGAGIIISGSTGLIGAGVIICESTGLIGAGVIICESTGLINKMKSWGPKGIVGINRELRNCLRVGAFPIYGNGGPLVNIPFKMGARMYSSLVTLKPKIKLDPGLLAGIRVDPNRVTGFVDGKGCFAINIRRNFKSKMG